MTLRRTLVPLVVALLVVAGCSDDKSPTSGASGAASTTASSTASVEAPRALRILVSNDDGVGAPGIDVLVKALLAEPDVIVTVVAPAENQSGSGGKTTPGPLTATEATTTTGYPAVAVHGFPADAVNHALTTVMTERPDVVISGTNAGQNLGPFIDLSGTVGAARAAAQRGIPALAVSAGLGDPIDFATASAAAVQWVRDHRALLVQSPAPAAFVDNLNSPSCRTGQVRAQAEVAPDPTASNEDALAASDCSSTAPAPTGDVAAFLIGFATISSLPLQPAS